MASDKPITVTVVGGGNSAHVLIPFLGETNHTVNLMTRRPTEWKDTVKCELQNMDAQVLETFHGTISKKSSNPADVIPDADVIILCMPVHQYRAALFNLAPHIDPSREVFVGTIYGQAGFNWMVHEMEKEFKQWCDKDMSEKEGFCGARPQHAEHLAEI